MKWHAEVTREQFATLAMHVEWAVMAQHAEIVAKPPRSIARIPAPVAIVLAVLGMLFGVWLIPRSPTLGGMTGGAFTAILASWAVVLVRRAQPRTTAGARIRRQVGRMLWRYESALPLSRDYEIRDGKLAAIGNRPEPRLYSIDAARAVAAVDVVVLFRRKISQLPYRLIISPPPELLDELRRRGTEVIELTDAPSGYVEPLPVARQR